MSKQMKVLLLEDVSFLGRSGDIVNVKPGYANNYLLPTCKAQFADKQAIRIQARLRSERLKQAAVDKEQSDAVAARINNIILSTEAKADEEGHLYGSVSVMDIVELVKHEGIAIEKHDIILEKPIKKVGEYKIALELKEGVTASFSLKVIAEGSLAESEENNSSE